MYKPLFDLFNDSQKLEYISFKSILANQLKKIKYFSSDKNNENNEYLLNFLKNKTSEKITNLSLSFYAKNSEEQRDDPNNPHNNKENFCINKNNKKKKDKNNNNKAKKNTKNKKINKDPEEAMIEKFKITLENNSVPSDKITKIEININKDWLNNLISN